MAQSERLICSSAALADGGKGVRFTLERHGTTVSAFVIRHRGRVFAYLNNCAHIPIELDWVEGEFFDKSGLYLICSTGLPSGSLEVSRRWRQNSQQRLKLEQGLQPAEQAGEGRENEGVQHRQHPGPKGAVGALSDGLGADAGDLLGQGGGC